MGRFQLFDFGIDVVAREGALDSLRDIDADRVARVVPTRVERGGIHFPEQEVIGDAQQRVGVQDLVGGTGISGGGEFLENGQVIVARIQPVRLAVFQGAPQFAGGVCVGPCGMKRTLRIELVDDARVGDVRAMDLERSGLEQRFDLRLQFR